LPFTSRCYIVMAMRKTNGNDVLRRVREAIGITQAQVARDTGLGPVHVSRIETGVYLIGADAALKVWGAYGPDFSALGYTLEDLLIGRAKAA